eukprot:9252235-Heterocapsa_arctica.AAC.1
MHTCVRQSSGVRGNCDIMGDKQKRDDAVQRRFGAERILCGEPCATEGGDKKKRAGGGKGGCH